MNNTTPCSAENLSYLQPAVIKGVVGEMAFQSGSQYAEENRVKIFDADDLYVASIVIGNFGYDQTQAIRLSGGKLLTSCSCVLDEPPFCRHCVAALLAYHNWVSPRLAKSIGSNNQTEAIADVDDLPTDREIPFSDITAFVAWLQPAFDAIEHGGRLPKAPRLTHGSVTAWMRLIGNLAEHQRDNEAVQAALRADVDARSSQVEQLTRQLEAMTGEARSAQGAYRALLAQLPTLARRLSQQEHQMKALLGELLKKGAQLDALSASFKETAAVLQSVADSSPQYELQ